MKFVIEKTKICDKLIIELVQIYKKLTGPYTHTTMYTTCTTYSKA